MDPTSPYLMDVRTWGWWQEHDRWMDPEFSYFVLWQDIKCVKNILQQRAVIIIKCLERLVSFELDQMSMCSSLVIFNCFNKFFFYPTETLSGIVIWSLDAASLSCVYVRLWMGKLGGILNNSSLKWCGSKRKVADGKTLHCLGSLWLSHWESDILVQTLLPETEALSLAGFWTIKTFNYWAAQCMLGKWGGDSSPGSPTNDARGVKQTQNNAPLMLV